MYSICVQAFSLYTLVLHSVAGLGELLDICERGKGGRRLWMDGGRCGKYCFYGVSMSDNEKIFTAEENRKITRATRLCETLGRDCGRFFKHAKTLDTVTGCPYLIYSLSQTKDGYRLVYLGDRYEGEGIDLTDTLDRFGADGFPSSYGLIGYDTEYEIGDSGHLMLSHQLAFMVSGVRFGLVISTDLHPSDICNSDLRSEHLT